MMPIDKDSNTSLVLSYLGLRKAVGIIGIALPFVLVIGTLLLDSPRIQPSLSDYYYTTMRNVFVGSLCAIGVFLMSYRGPAKEDDVAGDLACIFAVGAALFPTPPDGNTSFRSQIIGYIHYTFAAALFLTFAYFSLCLFRKTDPNKTMTVRKHQRNTVYTWCGWIILASIVLILVYALFLQNTFVKNLNPVFWLESAAVLAFGISWFTKGEAILKDQEG